MRFSPNSSCALLSNNERFALPTTVDFLRWGEANGGRRGNCDALPWRTLGAPISESAPSKRAAPFGLCEVAYEWRCRALGRCRLRTSALPASALPMLGVSGDALSFELCFELPRSARLVTSSATGEAPAPPRPSAPGVSLADRRASASFGGGFRHPVPTPVPPCSTASEFHSPSCF